MAGIRRFKLIIGIFIPFLLIFLMSHNTFAVQYNSWINIQDLSRTNLDNDYVIHNTPNAGSYGFANTTSLNTKVLSASANLSSQVTGGYFNASGDILLHIPSSLEGGVNCSNIDVAEIVPENVTFNVSSSTMSSCVETIPNPYYRLYTIHIATSGSISSGSPSSFYFSLRNTNNLPFISLVGTPNDSPRVFVSGDINFNMSSSPELEALGEVNQNIVIISDQIQDLSSQMDENTEAIIKSNQRCYKNLFNFNNSFGYNIAFANGSATETHTASSVTMEAIGTFGAQYVSWVSNELNASKNYSLTFKGKKLVLGSAGRPILQVIRYGSNDLSNWTNIGQFIVTSPEENREYSFEGTLTGYKYYRLYFYNNALTPVTPGEKTTYYNIQIIEGTTLSNFIEPDQEYCVNINEEYYNEQRQAEQNISNQTPSDIQGSENQTTTNLIGVLSGFISAFSNINATNCNLTLEFPNYAGGTRVVDICQGKERAPRIVEIGSSLLLIGVFVPLAYFLIKMIYNEIRSWTNG